MHDLTPPQDPADQYLSFSVAGTDYGTPIAKVREILPFEGATPLPGVPPSVRGVMNVRGAAVPVVDLRVKLGRDPVAAMRRSCVLVTESVIGDTEVAVGVLADAVNEVIELRASDVEAAPQMLGLGDDVVRGLGKRGDRFVVLLDLDRVLAGEDLPPREAAGEPERLRPAPSPPTPRAEQAGEVPPRPR